MDLSQSEKDTTILVLVLANLHFKPGEVRRDDLSAKKQLDMVLQRLREGETRHVEDLAQVSQLENELKVLRSKYIIQSKTTSCPPGYVLIPCPHCGEMYKDKTRRGTGVTNALSEADLDEQLELTQGGTKWCKSCEGTFHLQMTCTVRKGWPSTRKETP